MPRPQPTESAITLPVPAADSVVGDSRRRLDRSAGWGVPAHVTVLYPFVPPAQLDDVVLDRVRSVARQLTATAAAFSKTGWFDRRVVYLEPEPDEWFRDTIAAMAAAFPECPPYGGAFGDTVPHLTIGHDEDIAAMEAAAEAVRSQLPVTALINRLWVMQGTAAPGSWTVVEEIELGTATSPWRSGGVIGEDS